MESIFIFVVAVCVAVLAFRGGSLPRRRWNYSRRGYPRAVPQSGFTERQGPDLTDVGQQMHAVMAGSFQKQRVMTASEYRLFAIIENEIASLRSGYRVFAQTSLGEILKSSDTNAFRSINSKRVDILIVDRGGWPYLAIEYQGGGHFQGTAAARDAVKKEALRKAGVRYLEFCATDTDDQIRYRLRENFVSQVSA